MTEPLRLISAACTLLVVLAGCASERPCLTQDVTVSAPTVTSFLYPACNGRTVRVIAHMKPHGSRVESLRILVTGPDGSISEEAPTVRVLSGARTQGVGVEGAAAVVYFTYPGPCDGHCVTMSVTVPHSAPCPYRLRLVPVMMSR